MCAGGHRSSVEGMSRTVHHAAGIAGIAVAVLLGATPAAAATNRPAGEGWDPPRPLIERVEVPAAADDTTDEAAQMILAAALGAALATAAGRRRSRHHPAGTGVIDITDTVLDSIPGRRETLSFAFNVPMVISRSVEGLAVSGHLLTL
jgi:hypothetical protein